MSFYTITILIGLILLLIFIFLSKHLYVADYLTDKCKRIFEVHPFFIWEFLISLLCIFIPVIGQIFLLSLVISFSVCLENYEVVSFVNLKGLTWEDYKNKTPEYINRYNNAPFYVKICRKIKKILTYNLYK